MTREIPMSRDPLGGGIRKSLQEVEVLVRGSDGRGQTDLDKVDQTILEKRRSLLCEEMRDARWFVRFANLQKLLEHVTVRNVRVDCIASVQSAP